MSTNNELEKFRQGTPEEIEKKLEEQKKKSLELARDAADIHCEDEEKPLASEIIEDLMKDRDLWEAKARTMIGFNDIYSFHKKEIIGMIQKIESVRFLAMIYSFTHTLFEKEKNQWGD